MSGPDFRCRLRLFLLVLSLGLLSACEWLFEEPLPRTNPRDENAAVYYFRATPQYNGGAMDRIRLSWKWAAEDPYNPGTVTVMRGASWYPSSPGDSSAVLVYQSGGNATEVFDDEFLETSQDGNSYFYTLFCEIDGYDDIVELPSPPTVFTLNDDGGRPAIDIPSAFDVSFAFDGNAYSGAWGLAQVAYTTAPPYESIALIVPDISRLPALNIDIVRVDVSYSSSLTDEVIFNRAVTEFPEEMSDEFYFNRLRDPSVYTLTDQVVHNPSGGSFDSSAGFQAILENWLDTLDIYGIRVSTGGSALNVLSGFNFRIYYVGPEW
jgi:hypothetical protein